MAISENTSLMLLSRADLALAEADTIYKLKELKNLALTAADWLKRKNASEDIIQKARSLALEAERKMGQMLIDTERHPPGPDKKDRCPRGTEPPTLSDMGLSKKESARAQRIARLAQKDFEKIKSGEKPVHWLAVLSDETNEWWTPKKYIEAVREVMGEIDLDPASCAEANKKVGAKSFYDREHDGLLKEWVGRVFLNPPYGSEGPKFIEKFFNGFGSSFTEGIVLVNSRATDAAWFQPLFEGVMCFTDHRIDFDSEKEKATQSTHGSCFVYYGPNKKKFAEIFGQFGSVVRRWPQ